MKNLFEQKEIRDRIFYFFEHNKEDITAEKMVNAIFPTMKVSEYLKDNFKPYKGKGRNYFYTSGDLSKFFLRRFGVVVNANTIGRLMTALGYTAKARSVGGATRRVYCVKPVSNVDFVELIKIQNND